MRKKNTSNRAVKAAPSLTPAEKKTLGKILAKARAAKAFKNRAGGS